MTHRLTMQLSGGDVVAEWDRLDAIKTDRAVTQGELDEMVECAKVSELVPKGPEVERLNYGVECTGIDFGMMNARNQLISKVVNPLIDKILASLKADRALRQGTDSETKYKVSIVVTSERDIDTVQ